MRWRPWKPWRPSNRGRTGPGRWLPILLLLAGCAGTVSAPIERRALPAEEWRYLVSPLAGYPLSVPADLALTLRDLADGLVLEQRWPEVRSEAEALLARDPGLHPASVILSQLDFLEGDFASSLRRLEPVVAELPEFTAAQLLAGRAAEKTGDLVRAYASYRAVAPVENLASARASQLRQRAVEIVYNRVEDALGRGRVEDAAERLRRLEEWAPEESLTLQAARAVAVASADLDAELAAVRSLSVLSPSDAELLERRAELELRVGEPGSGLRILQDLSSRRPEDRRLAEKLSEAKFLWRMAMLPSDARGLADLPELTRADFAALLYWLFPNVRFGQARSGLIVNDVLDHERRDEIVRVVNLGLMSVDRALHRFEPERPVTRLTALNAYLTLLAGREPRLACLGSFEAAELASVGAVCGAAARCGLIPEVADCLPAGAVSGAAARRLSREVLESLGIE